MKKTIFIIPGYGGRANDKYQGWMKPFFKKKGFIVKEVPVHWKYRTMSDYVEEFELFYEKNKSEKNYVLGFSFGAVIALISAEVLSPDKLFLCSLSPYFKEDFHAFAPRTKRFLGVKKYKDFKKYSAKTLTKNLSIPTVIFYGETEGKKFPQLKVRAEETVKTISKGRLIVVKDAPHQIDFPAYVEAIKREFD
jgi:esterase/lipase